MIEGEFDEIDETEAGEEQLDLTEDDSLPWLESDEEEAGGGFDYMQFAGFFVVLLVLLGALVGGIWLLSNNTQDPEVVADGSTIEAPEGPYKVKPDDPGGKQFEGTGNVAPAVGEGQTRDGKVADSGESEDGSGGSDGEASAAGSSQASGDSSSSGSSSSGSAVGVQVGAYGSQKRAEEGWATLSRSSAALEGVRYRIVKGQADIGTVYRLQALASDRASADRLCNALKADGLPCQVKP